MWKENKKNQENKYYIENNVYFGLIKISRKFFLHTRHSLKIANSVLTGQNAYYQFKYTSTIKLSYIGVVKV